MVPAIAQFEKTSALTVVQFALENATEEFYEMSIEGSGELDSHK
jgi:hypothetical protein